MTYVLHASKHDFTLVLPAIGPDQEPVIIDKGNEEKSGEEWNTFHVVSGSSSNAS